MTRETELHLILLAKNGDKNALEKIWFYHRPWILRALENYFGDWKDDLIQECFLGLHETIMRFNPDLGYRLRSLAKHRVRMHILRYFSYMSQTTKFNSITRKKAFDEEFPTFVPLFDEQATSSANAPDLLYEKQIKKAIRTALYTLTEREHQVITETYMEGKTLEELSTILNITRQRVQQIRDEAIRKVKFRLKPIYNNLCKAA